MNALIGYTETVTVELQDALNNIASAKSPKAREDRTLIAHLMNARYCRDLLLANVKSDSAWRIEDATVINEQYLDWERAIMTVADLNRRALRK